MDIASFIYVLAYDGEGAGDNKPPATPPATPKDTPPATPKDPPAGDLEKERARLLKVQEGLQTELEAMRTQTSMTEKEREDAHKRIEDLQNQLLTREQLTKKEAEKRDKEFKSQVETLTSERDQWKNRYVNDTIVRSLSEAAVEHDAYNPAQIVDILRGRTIVDETDGKIAIKVKLEDVNDKGETVMLDLDPKQAVKQLSEKESFLNLFKSGVKGGLGGRGSNNNQEMDIARLARENPEEYRKLRTEGKI